MANLAKSTESTRWSRLTQWLSVLDEAASFSGSEFLFQRIALLEERVAELEARRKPSADESNAQERADEAANVARCNPEACGC